MVTLAIAILQQYLPGKSQPVAEPGNSDRLAQIVQHKKRK